MRASLIVKSWLHVIHSNGMTHCSTVCYLNNGTDTYYQLILRPYFRDKQKCYNQDWTRTVHRKKSPQLCLTTVLNLYRSRDYTLTPSFPDHSRWLRTYDSLQQHLSCWTYKNNSIRGKSDMQEHVLHLIVWLWYCWQNRELAGQHILREHQNKFNIFTLCLRE